MKCLNMKLVVSGVFICLAAFLVAFSGSCGKSKNGLPSVTVEPTIKSGRSVWERRKIPPLEELLAELDALEKPPEVDGALWTGLKAEMREWLLETFGNSKEVSRYPGDDREPYEYLGTTDYVKARDLCWESEGNYGKLVWRYVNDGDYNQDSQVSIADITPLAIYYGQQVGDEVNTIRELIDEDDDDTNDDGILDVFNGDGWIEGEDNQHHYHNDFETIQRNFHVEVAEYEVRGSNDKVNWIVVTTIPFSNGSHESGFRDTFEYELTNEDYRYYKIRALDGNGEPWYHEQAESNVVESDPIDLAPKIESVSPDPIKGRPDKDTVGRIYAKVSGAGSLSYAWDFAGHLIPNTSDLAEVENGKIIGPIGEFDDASLTVTNAYGEDTRNFNFSVTEDPVAPEIHRIWMEYQGEEFEAGDPGWEVTFHAEVTGSTPLSYSWNFGGGATPNTSTLKNPTVILGDARIEAYNGTLAVSNDAGAVLEGFQYSVGRHVDIGDITPLTDGLSGEQKTFQVTFSGTPPIHYEWRFGGGTEPNEFSGSVGEPGEIGPFAVEVDVTLLNGLPYDQHLTAAYDNIPGNEARTYVGSIAAWNDVFNEALSKPFILRVTSRWHMEDIELVVYDEVTPEDISLDFNSTWNPAISFQRNWWLWFAEHDGVEWSTEPIDEQNHSGHYSSLKFDSLDRPNVSYSAWPGNYQPGILRFARRDDGAWYTQDVDTNATNSVGGYNSLELFPGNRPAISYLDDDDWSLKYAHATAWIPGIGWQWSIETVVEGSDEDSVTGFISLALRNDADPVITYARSTLISLNPPDIIWVGKVELVERIVGEWQPPQTVEEKYEGVFLNTSLALNSAGSPKVAYYRDFSERDLRFAQWGGETWVPETVDDEEGLNKVGYYASLALDGDDRPLIGYYAEIPPSGSELRVAYCLPGVLEESDWVIDTLPLSELSVYAVSLALDANDNPAIAFMQFKERYDIYSASYWLKFAHFW